MYKDEIRKDIEKDVDKLLYGIVFCGNKQEIREELIAARCLFLRISEYTANIIDCKEEYLNYKKILTGKNE